MIENLMLSNWNQSPTVYVPENISSHLRNYHIVGIRFLYDAFAKKRRGVLFNVEADMNIQLQLSAFLSALILAQERNNVIIISHVDNISKWVYHLKKIANLPTVLLTCEQDYFKDDIKGNRIIVVSMADIDLLKNCPFDDLFSVILEDFDLIANKLVIRKLKGHFNVGITYKNYILNQDNKVHYDMLHWLDPEKYRNKKKFLDEHSDHYLNLRNAYDEDWFRLTWNFSDNFKKYSVEEQENFNTDMFNWCQENNISNRIISSPPKRKKVSLKSRRSGKLVRSSSNKILKVETDCESSNIQLPCMDELPILNSIRRNLL